MKKIVNILTFHHIHNQQDSLSITPSIFEKLISELKKNYTFISYEDFTQIILGKKTPKKNSVLISIDDGYLDNYIYAYPILKKLDVPAVIFLITNNILTSSTCRAKLLYFRTHKELQINSDKKLFINKCEIQKMKNSGLISFESHTTSHMVCKNINESVLKKEFSKSLEFIKDLDKKEFYGFCWPRGYFDKTALEVIKKFYSFSFSTIDGGHNFDDDLYTLKRIDCSSWNGNQKKYIARVKRKLFIYSTPFLSKFYSNFREYQIKKKKARKIRAKQK